MGSLLVGMKVEKKVLKNIIKTIKEMGNGSLFLKMDKKVQNEIIKMVKSI